MTKKGAKIRFTKKVKGAEFADQGVMKEEGKDGPFIERASTIATEKGDVRAFRGDWIEEED